MSRTQASGSFLGSVQRVGARWLFFLFAVAIAPGCAKEPIGEIARISKSNHHEHGGAFRIELLPERREFEMHHDRRFYVHVYADQRQLNDRWITCRLDPEPTKDSMRTRVLGAYFEDAIAKLSYKYVPDGIEIGLEGNASTLLCPLSESDPQTIELSFGYVPTVWMASDEAMEDLVLHLPRRAAAQLK